MLRENLRQVTKQVVLQELQELQVDYSNDQVVAAGPDKVDLPMLPENSPKNWGRQGHALVIGVAKLHNDRLTERRVFTEGKALEDKVQSMNGQELKRSQLYALNRYRD